MKRYSIGKILIQKENLRNFYPKRDGAQLYPNSVGVVRYADDFVVVCPTEGQARGMYEKLQPYLDKRGLKLAQEKTRVVHISEGFDFLGFNVRQYPTKEGNQLFIKPSNESVKNAKRKIKEVFDWGKGRETTKLIEKLNRVIQGIANYWSPTVAKVIFRDIDTYVNERVLIYLKHRHHRTSIKKLRKMYFKPDHTGVSKDKWILTCPNDNTKQLICMSWTKIERHVKIKQHNSPFDASLKHV